MFERTKKVLTHQKSECTKNSECSKIERTKTVERSKIFERTKTVRTKTVAKYPGVK